ncbi:hypothetical protein [Butyrivibrio sp. XPD2006]|jgi:hypothetical protein|uniref:hypothetical protein n=1 Tax=Butyrivibrio sp. XPD2006 TaxID=1280668 RepID=UPI0003B4F988|nr:hypothetical protein [Butyrivibrio sp. XPD2006]
MMIFAYTFIVVFVALVVILGLGSLLTRGNEVPEIIPEGAATAAMCTTQLLGRCDFSDSVCDDDFVIEQDLVFTYDSINL